jgi:hypothetical protein
MATACTSLFLPLLSTPLARMHDTALLHMQVPTLATAAEYFFKEGALGKRLRPTVLLLMASALDTRGPPGAHLCAVDHAPPRETPTGTSWFGAGRV